MNVPEQVPLATFELVQGYFPNDNIKRSIHVPLRTTYFSNDIFEGYLEKILTLTQPRTLLHHHDSSS